MRSHTWMHGGILAAIVVVFGLRALGVAVPSAVIYLILLACPLMMGFMMFGMNHGDATPERSDDLERAPASTSPGSTSRIPGRRYAKQSDQRPDHQDRDQKAAT